MTSPRMPFVTLDCSKVRVDRIRDLDNSYINREVEIRGWVRKIRDHGNLTFFDVKDGDEIVQCVLEPTYTKDFEDHKVVTRESVIKLDGMIRERAQGTRNPAIKTGNIELEVKNFQIISIADPIPFDLDDDCPTDDLRLKFRFLDLRRGFIKERIIFKSKMIKFLRETMWSLEFNEIQTPIITGDKSSEGAKNFIVLSSIKKGVYYSLPQAPQIFKQLLMSAGFGKYFQIAPCFRDENSRADRSPGEFYQLDLEMSFIEQEDVISLVEKVITNLFTNFSKKPITEFVRIDHKDSMNYYCCDKPDLRNPVVAIDITDILAKSGLEIFKKSIESGDIAKGIVVPVISKDQAKRFDQWAKMEHMPGMGCANIKGDTAWSLAKLMTREEFDSLRSRADQALSYHSRIIGNKRIDDIFEDKYSLMIISGPRDKVINWTYQAMKHIGKELSIIDQSKHAFCWVLNKPMYEIDEDSREIGFGHNPFSMPQVSVEEFDKTNPMDIYSYQYDIVCDGMELGSGAIRNYNIELMYKIFSIVGYSKEQIDHDFAALADCFRYGIPPHGGIALGIERLAMILSSAESIRDVIAFPLNQSGKDIMMGAPYKISEKIVKDFSLKSPIEQLKQ